MPLREEQSVASYIIDFYPLICPDVDIVASRNGALLDDPNSVIAKEGDSIVLCPVFHGGGDGKNPLKIVAQLAVVIVASLVTYGIGTSPSAAAMFGSEAAAMAVGAVAGAAISAVGGMIVNAVFPSTVSGASTDLSDSETYSWGTGSNPYEEGTAVPTLFGKMRVTPTIISSYTQSEDDSQYLSILYMIAEGEITSISDVYINDNNYTNYEDIEIETRLGENTQDVISYFGDTYSDTTVYSKLDEDAVDWVTATTPGNAADGLVAVLVCPSGLWHIDSSGDMETYKVYVEIQSALYDDDTETYGDWTSWGTTTISGSDYTTIRKTVRKDNVTPGKYQIRAQFITAPNTDSDYGSDTYLDYIQEVYYDDFTYPNTALLGVYALATDQLNGSMPTTTCLAERATVTVNGTEKDASNPAWASWDMLTNDISGIGISEDKLIYDEFEEWADWCDEKGIYCGLYVDSSMTAPSAMDLLCQLGRGVVIQRGNKYGVIVDKPSDPVQMFTVGNIIADSFEETWLDLADRANVIQVDYWDEDDDYARTTFELRTDAYITDSEDIETSIELTGCTNATIAANHAQYLLNCNKYLLRTVSITVSIDAIACQPGDVILIQHDVPEWGYGGRVQDYDSTTGQLTLDRDIEMPDSAGSYGIMLRHSVDDSLEQLTLSNGEETTAVVTASTSWATDPEAGDIYSVGQVETITKPFRIVSISKSSDLACTITCLEYYDEIYEDTGEVPTITDFSHLTYTSNLKGTTTVRTLEGLQKNVLCLSWSGSALSWNVYKRFLGSGDTWEYVGTTNSPRYDVFNLQDNRYYELNVSHTGSPSGGQTVIVNFPGDATPAGLELVYTSDGTTKITTSGFENIYIIGS